MYAKLLRTPESELPSLTQQVEIKSQYMNVHNKSYAHTGRGRDKSH